MQDIHQQVQEHEKRRQHQDHPLEHWDVALENGKIQQKYRSRPAKDRLHQHLAAEEVAELNADDGQNGDRGVVQDVPPSDPPR